MAKRRKTKTKKSRGRVRGNGGGGALVMSLIGMKVGELAGGLIMKFTAGMNVSPYIIGAGEGFIGWFLAFKNRNPLAQGAGVSLLYAGTATVLAQAGVLKGIGAAGRQYKIPLKTNGKDNEMSIVNGNGKGTGQAPHWQRVVSGMNMA